MKLKFFIFVIFNHFYKDGKNETPLFSTILIIMFYQMVCLVFTVALVEKFLNISILHRLLEIGTYFSGLLIFAILIPLNYFYFIKGKGLWKIYLLYNNSEFNTKKNRIVYGLLLIAGFLGAGILAGNLKNMIS